MAIVHGDVVGLVDTLLISQYRHSNNLNKYIKAFVSPLTETMQAMSDAQDVLSIEKAYGQSLDRIGRIVGISRVIPGASALGLFGFNANAQATGFGVGVFYSAGDPISGELVLNDQAYRKYIRAKILVNTKSATIEDMIIYTELILGRTAPILITEGDRSAQVHIQETLGVPDKSLLAISLKAIKPIGVTLTLRDDAGIIALT